MTLVKSEVFVEIVAYDPSWPSAFKKEQRALSVALAPWLVGEIEHVGSTAVVDMAAKPVIDLMAPVASLEASRPAIESLVELGFSYSTYRTDVMHWFCKPSPAHRTHHLHLVPFGSLLWHDRIRFRDALRESAALADEYARLKRELAARHKLDREAYTEAKGPFVERVLAQIRRERGAA